MYPLLEFTRDGTRILIGSQAGVTIVDPREVAPPHVIAVEDLQALTAIGDQIWAVAGRTPTLTAYTPSGATLGSTPLPPAPPGSLLHRASESKLATWPGEPWTTIAFEHGLVTTALADGLEFALAISSSRVIIASRQKLSLRDRDATRWTVPLAKIGTIIDATLVFDGRALALSVRSGKRSRAIVVLGLRDGALLHRMTVPPESVVRFAGTRGVALVVSPGERLVLVDLRFGRVVVEHRDPDLTAVAVDASGKDLAFVLSSAPTSVSHITVAELGQRSAASTVVASEPELPEITLASSEPEPSQLPTVSPFACDFALTCEAIPQRLAMEPTTPDETLALDAQQRELAITIVGAAIARAWDEGRLAYPQREGLPFYSEVGGLISGQRGLAREELGIAQQRLDEARANELESRASVAPRLGPLDALEHELGLSPIAREILLLAAAPALWGEIARLYGILSNDDGRPLLDELLLGDLLFERATRGEISRELDDDAPLVRLGIVQIQSGTMRPFLPIVIEPVVLKLLRGAPLEPELQPLVEVRNSDCTFEALRIPTAVKRKIATDLAEAASPLRVVIRGRHGAGRHTLAAAIGATSARALGVIDATVLVRDPRRIGELGVALDRVHLAGLLPCVDGLEHLPSTDVALRDQVRELLRQHAGPVILRLPIAIQPPLHAGYVAIDLPPLTLTDRLTTWTEVLAAHHLEVSELAELADRFGVGPGVVERVVASVARTSQESSDRDAGPRLDTALRQHLEARLEATADRVTRLASWNQIILPEDIEDSLTELIARIKHRRVVFDRWGFDRLLSTSRGVTALFQGGPGTGKTLVASAIANELGMDLYRVDLSRVMSKWIGETEQNLAKLFDAAEDGNTIILFDEADSLFAKRTEVKSSVDRYANLEVNYLLQRIDSFEGIAILTTNFGTSIDNAFKRRLSLRLTFPFPDEDMREKLWRAHLPPEVPRSGDFDLAEIARRYQISGGYIRNVTLRAAFLAVEEHSALTQAHLERAIKAEFREIGKIAESGVLE